MLQLGPDVDLSDIFQDTAPCTPVEPQISCFKFEGPLAVDPMNMPVTLDVRAMKNCQLLRRSAIVLNISTMPMPVDQHQLCLEVFDSIHSFLLFPGLHSQFLFFQSNDRL